MPLPSQRGIEHAGKVGEIRELERALAFDASCGPLR
jgi:hypothetical protein